MRLIVLERQRFEKFSFFSDHPVLQFYHPLLSDTAQVGAATLPHRLIYPILPYVHTSQLPISVVV